MGEARIEDVDGGVLEGTRMKIRGGRYGGLELKGLPASALRKEQIRFNSESGKTEAMVAVGVPFDDGRMSLPLDMPRRHLQTAYDQNRVVAGFSRAFARGWEAIFGTVPTRRTA